MSLDITSKYRIAATVTGDAALDKFGRSLANVDRTGRTTTASLVSGFGSLRGALASLGVTVGLGALAHLFKQSLDAAGGLGELSEQLGVSTRTLQAMQYAATQAGVSNSELETGLARLTRTIGDAAEGEKEAIEAFDRLGIGVLDAAGKVRATEDVIRDVANALKGMDDPARRAASVVDLFGKSGQKMLPLLSGGEDGIRRFIAEAERMGVVLGEDAIGAADIAADKIAALGVRFDKLAQKAAAAVAGPLNDFMAWLDEFNAENAEDSARVRGVIDQIKALDAAETEVKALEAKRQLIADSRANAESLGLFGTVFAMSEAEYEAEAARVDQALAEARKKLAAVEYLGGLGKNPGRAFPSIRPTKGAYNPPPDETGGTTAKRDDGAEAIKALERELALIGDLTREEQTLYDVTVGRYAAESAGEKERLLQLARQIDLKTALAEAAKADQEAAEEAAKAAQKEAEEIERRRDAIREQIAALGNQAAAIAMSTKEADRFAFALDLVADGFARGSAEFNQFMADYDAAVDKIARAQDDWTAGARRGLLDYADAAKDVAGQTEDAFVNAFGGLEDAIIQFRLTGKASFKDFANSVIDDISRILVRTQVTGPLAGFLGGLFNGGGIDSAIGDMMAANPSIFAGGGIMTSRGPLPIRQYLGGGVARTPQLAIFGEGSTDEAFVPVPNGRIPVELRGGGSGGVVVNTSIVVNQTAGGATSETTGDAEGKAFGERLAVAVKAVVADEVRPGGLIDQAARRR